jgi:hypothetical protein
MKIGPCWASVPSPNSTGDGSPGMADSIGTIAAPPPLRPVGDAKGSGGSATAAAATAATRAAALAMQWPTRKCSATCGGMQWMASSSGCRLPAAQAYIGVCEAKAFVPFPSYGPHATMCSVSHIRTHMHVQTCLCSSSSSRKVGLTPTAVFALATPKSPIDRGMCARVFLVQHCHSSRYCKTT